jgi:hypothetical protein
MSSSAIFQGYTIRVLNILGAILYIAGGFEKGRSESKKSKQSKKVLDKEPPVNVGVSKNVRKYRRCN